MSLDNDITGTSFIWICIATYEKKISSLYVGAGVQWFSRDQKLRGDYVWLRLQLSRLHWGRVSDGRYLDRHSHHHPVLFRRVHVQHQHARPV